MSQLPHLIPSRHPPSAILTSGGSNSRFAKSPPTHHTSLYHNYTLRRAPSTSGSSPSTTKMSFYACSASSHEGLVENLRKTGVIRSDAVFDAMRKTDRAKYMAQVETPDGGHVGNLACYADSPHPIGYNQTISAPHMVSRKCRSELDHLRMDHNIDPFSWTNSLFYSMLMHSSWATPRSRTSRSRASWTLAPVRAT